MINLKCVVTDVSGYSIGEEVPFPAIIEEITMYVTDPLFWAKSLISGNVYELYHWQVLLYNEAGTNEMNIENLEMAFVSAEEIKNAFEKLKTLTR